MCLQSMVQTTFGKASPEFGAHSSPDPFSGHPLLLLFMRTALPLLLSGPRLFLLLQGLGLQERSPSGTFPFFPIHRWYAFQIYNPCRSFRSSVLSRCAWHKAVSIFRIPCHLCEYPLICFQRYPKYPPVMVFRVEAIAAAVTAFIVAFI